jgi:hypothetical protein
MVTIPDDTVAKYWQWAFNLTPPLPAFVINSTDDPSYVFLLDTADAHGAGTLNMSGHCPGNKKIMFCLWVGYCTTQEYPRKLPPQLAVLAQDEYNMGHITSTATDENGTFATLDIEIRKNGGPVNRTDNGSSGHTEHTHSSGFGVTIPNNSIKQFWGSTAGTCTVATSGFYAVHDALSNGTHTISYSTQVGDLDGGRSPRIPYTSKNITYTLTVP